MTPFKALITFWLLVLGAVVVGWDNAIMDQNGGAVLYGFYALVGGCMLTLIGSMATVNHGLTADES